MPGLVVEIFPGTQLPIPADAVPSATVATALLNFSDTSTGGLMAIAAMPANFALRFTGFITASTTEALNVTFYLTSDDASKLYINGVLVGSDPGVHGLNHWSVGTAALSAGANAIEVHYSQRDGNTGLILAARPAIAPVGTPLTKPPPPVAKMNTVQGVWAPLIKFPLVPAAAAVYNGQVMTWASYLPYTIVGSGDTYTATLNLATGVVSELTVSNTRHDMFCPGISRLADGRVMVTGGDDADRTSFYSASGAGGSWSTGPNMNIARGYQASAVLSDGRVFTIGGSWSGGCCFPNKTGEVWSPTTNRWTRTPGCAVTPMLTDDWQGLYRQDNHGWLFGWSGGTVFQAGPSRAMNWYNPNGQGSWTAAGPRGDDSDAMNGNAAMFDAVAGKILTVGGATSYQQRPATANANLITIGAYGTKPTVKKLASMHFTRAFCNSVVLPDGTVLTMGGQNYPVPFTDTTPVFNAELWNPVTETFTVLAKASVPRNYHSIALLLPDGTVFNGGGGLCGVGCAQNHPDAQIFTPPYLFNPDGTPATRPVITAVTPTTVNVGGFITVTTAAPNATFSLMREGSTTHAIDTDQRRVPLVPTFAAGPVYTFVLPSDPGILLPGLWMLFVLSSAGVPSLSTTVMITIP